MRRTLAFLLLPLFAAGLRAQSTATLTGTVRDSTGAGIADVEITLRETSYATRTNAKGDFALANVPIANYRALFRRLGYRSVEYTWGPSAGEKTTITVALDRIAQTLDPVKVRAEEDRRFAANSSIQGLVVDSGGYPIAEAELRIIGANTAGMTRANGGFLFKPMAIGTYVIRVRKLGYSPVTVTIDLHKDDDREVYIRLTPLAQNLDAVVINDSSGFGNQRAWDELERRRRFKDFNAVVLGKDGLARFYSMPLGMALSALGMNLDGYSPRPVPRFRPDIMEKASSHFFEDDSCILLNGTTPIRQPLTWNADELELLEVYPNNTELSGTVASHFGSPPCAPTSLLAHPTYYVVWLKKGKAK